MPRPAGAEGAPSHLPHRQLAALVARHNQLLAPRRQCAHRVVVAQQRLGGGHQQGGVPTAHQLQTGRWRGAAAAAGSSTDTPSRGAACVGSADAAMPAAWKRQQRQQAPHLVVAAGVEQAVGADRQAVHTLAAVRAGPAGEGGVAAGVGAGEQEWQTGCPPHTTPARSTRDVPRAGPPRPAGREAGRATGASYVGQAAE